jgi:hypothetical protein
MYPLTSSSQLPFRQSPLPNSDKSYCVRAYEVVRVTSHPHSNLVRFNPKPATFHAVFTCRLFHAPRHICTQLHFTYNLDRSSIQSALLPRTLLFISLPDAARMSSCDQSICQTEVLTITISVLSATLRQC